MISIEGLRVEFGVKPLFQDVSFVINDKDRIALVGKNGAGKSTMLKILCGMQKPTSGNVAVPTDTTIGYLPQVMNLQDSTTVKEEARKAFAGITDLKAKIDELNKQLSERTDYESDEYMALVHKFSDEHDRYMMMGADNYEAEIERTLTGLGFSRDDLERPTTEFSGGWRMRIELAKILLAKPDVLLLDEPTNHLDIEAVRWLEEFLSEYFGTVIVVSHDRHFLNNVCTHIVDIDYNKIKMYVGNYEFWYESSQLIQRMIKQQNKKNEEKIKELKSFIERFSANKSKSNQATSRRKLIEKLTVEELPASSRRYPFIGFDMDRELGKDVLQVEGLSKTVDGVKLLDNVSFTLGRTDKVAFIGESEQAITMLFKILMEEEKPDSGSFKWGVSVTSSYMPVDNNAYFNDCKLSILEWIRQYSVKDETETYLRGFLGRMLFSGDDVYKPVNVLSGGEKVRCMFSRMMLFGSNVLVLDRPTNHLDLESITAVNNSLINFKGVVLLASHDHEILQTTANRIIEITPDGCIDRQGTYEEYMEFRKNMNA